MPDHPLHPAHLLADWQHFLSHGFRQEDFTPALHHFLITHFPLEAPGHTPADFWRYFFAADLGRLQRFLDVVAGPDPPRTRLDATHPLRDGIRETLRTLKPALLKANPDRLEHWSLAYDAHFPFDEHAPYLQVTPRVRQLLGRVARCLLTVPRQTTLFGAYPAMTEQSAHLPAVADPQFLFHHLKYEVDTDAIRLCRLAVPANEGQRQQSILSVRRRHLESHR